MYQCSMCAKECKKKQVNEEESPHQFPCYREQICLRFFQAVENLVIDPPPISFKVAFSRTER